MHPTGWGYTSGINGKICQRSLSYLHFSPFITPFPSEKPKKTNVTACSANATSSSHFSRSEVEFSDNEKGGTHAECASVTKHLIANLLNASRTGHDSRLIGVNHDKIGRAKKKKTLRSPTKTKRDRLADRSMQEKGRMSPGKKQARQKTKKK